MQIRNTVYDVKKDDLLGLWSEAQAKVRDLNDYLVARLGRHNSHALSLWLKPLDDPRFLLFPASTKKHHTEVGGLLTHTTEVIKLAEATYTSMGNTVPDCVLLAALWHDYGKVHDYEVWIFPNGTCDATRTEHYTRTHHVVSSWEMFREVSRSMLGNWSQEMRQLYDDVSHCILAHHGKLEWGSPVTPRTSEAWAVHLADMTSAYVYGLRHLATVPRPEENKTISYQGQ